MPAGSTRRRPHALGMATLPGVDFRTGKQFRVCLDPGLLPGQAGTRRATHELFLGQLTAWPKIEKLEINGDAAQKGEGDFGWRGAPLATDVALSRIVDSYFRSL